MLLGMLGNIVSQRWEAYLTHTQHTLKPTAKLRRRNLVMKRTNVEWKWS